MMGHYKWGNWIDRLLLRLRYPKVIFYPSDGDDSWWELGKNLKLMPYCILYSGVQIGDGTLVAPFAQIRENSLVGMDCKIGAKCNVEWSVTIGDRVKMQGLSMISEKAIIGNDVFIAMCVSMATDKYMDGGSCVPVHIHDGAKIGGGVTILPGTEIGVNTIVGAGCVATGNIPAGKVVYAGGAKGNLMRDVAK